MSETAIKQLEAEIEQLNRLVSVVSPIDSEFIFGAYGFWYLK